MEQTKRPSFDEIKSAIVEYKLAQMEFKEANATALEKVEKKNQAYKKLLETLGLE